MDNRHRSSGRWWLHCTLRKRKLSDLVKNMHDMYTLITGSSSGIGRQTAIHLSKSRRLILHGRDMARLEETKRLCFCPDHHIVWDLDLKDIIQIEESLLRRLKDLQAGVECFIHCAGTLKVMPIRSVRGAIVEEIMNVNFASAVEITRLLVTKKVNEKKLRSIVFVSSTASRFGARGFNLYCASKGALDAFMRALAVELAPNVRVNSVLPGAVRTSMTDTMMTDPDLKSRFAEQYPLGIGEPSDIASAIEFLISDNARWITGQQLIVDGGCSVNITA